MRPIRVLGWMVHAAGDPMVARTREVTPALGEVVVQVAGCGVCHTDLGFYYDGVPTRHGFPLTLGHEIAGRVVEAGPGAQAWIGKAVIVPAVIPCGKCDACRDGRGGVCPRQIFPGSDVHGGFATHVCVPAQGLCPVPALEDRKVNPHDVSLAQLSVVADAISTPYQAVFRSALAAGDLAIFVGAGGVGGFGVQVAATTGAAVAAIDVETTRLQLVGKHGAGLALNAAEMDFKQLRDAVRKFAAERDIPTWRWKVFETSGTTAGQATAFGFVGPGSYLAIVGFTPQKLELRLSNLMAFDATVQGNWGCLPEHYPRILDLVLSGRIALAPFVETRALATIQETFEDIHARRTSRRVILVPET